MTGTCLILIIFLAATSIARNSLWKDEVILWEDSAQKSFVSGRPFTNKGGGLNAQKKYVEAVAAYTTALERTPMDYTAHCGLAFALFHLGRYDEAISEYRKAMGILDNPLYHENLAIVLEKKGAYREAIEELSALIKTSPNNISLRAHLLTLFYNIGERKKYLLSLIEKGRISQDPYDLFDAGWACTALERNHEAEGYFRKTLVSLPDLPAARYFLGLILGRLGKTDEAIDLMETAMMEPLIYRSAESHYNLGILYHMKGDERSAVREYTLALEREPTHSHAHNNLGIVYFSLGKKAKALMEFQAAVKADPKNAEARKNLLRLTGLTLTSPCMLRGKGPLAGESGKIPLSPPIEGRKKP